VGTNALLVGRSTAAIRLHSSPLISRLRWLSEHTERWALRAVCCSCRWCADTAVDALVASEGTVSVSKMGISRSMISRSSRWGFTVSRSCACSCTSCVNSSPSQLGAGQCRSACLTRSHRSIAVDLWESIGTQFPPRTNLTTNTSRWNGGCGEPCNNADAWWRWYEDAGFNTFIKGWMGTGYAEGYGEMLTYLHAHLNTSIMPILNVGNTQEIFNAKTTQAKVDEAGLMARNFANSSFLLYCAPTLEQPHCAFATQFTATRGASALSTFCRYFLRSDIQDEVGSVEPTASINAAVQGNDTYHPTMSLFCGIQCGPQAWDSRVYSEIAAVHDVFGIDSYTEYKHIGLQPWNVRGTCLPCCCLFCVASTRRHLCSS
jgi:hypothetical protein